MKKKPRPKVRLVFMYREVWRTKKVHNVFRVVGDDGELGELRAYRRKRGGILGCASSGCIYEVEVDPEDESSTYPSTARYVATWGDDDACAQWASRDATGQSLERSMKESKAAHRTNWMLKRLEPLKEAYARMSSAERAHLLSLVVRRIVGGK